MKKNKQHKTNNGLSGYDHDNLLSYDATNSNAGTLEKNFWWLAINGDATKVLAKRYDKYIETYCNPYESVIQDLADNIFASSLKLKPVFLKEGYKKCQ